MENIYLSTILIAAVAIGSIESYRVENINSKLLIFLLNWFSIRIHWVIEIIFGIFIGLVDCGYIHICGNIQVWQHGF